MTAPVSHGYPDFGRFVAHSDKQLASVDQSIAATTYFGPYFVGDVPHLRFFALPRLDGMRLTFFFYENSNLTNLIDWTTVDVPLGADAHLSTPVLGPYLYLSVSPNTGAGSLQLMLATTSYPFYPTTTIPQSHILCNLYQSVSAATTVSSSAIYVIPGAAHWFCYTNATAWTLSIWVWDYVGNATIIESHTGTAAGSLRGVLYLPPMRVELRFENSDGVSRVVRSSVVVRGLEPGR